MASDKDVLGPLSVSFPKGFSAGGRRRKSVSAEVDKGEEKWEKKVVVKTEDAIARIKKATEHSFLFASLTDDQKKDIYDCMTEVKVEKGEDVIKQNAEGDFFYIIDSGKFDVLKKDGSDTESEYKCVYRYDGEGSFGELALMYNCPRAATVRAESDGVLWAVDRATFRHIVVTNAARERKKREEWLEQVPILINLTKQERSQVADSLVTKEFKDGEYVIRMGEKGDSFYIIESGEAVATQFSKKEKKDVEVGRMKAGEYFGERALLTNQKRAANVKAVGDLKVAVIDRATFERLFGSCQKVMKRVIEKYPTVADE